MKALQYIAIGEPPEIREVPRPKPGPGEVLIKVTAAGVCHSDEYFMGLSAEEYTFGLPMTLGHEGAGDRRRARGGRPRRQGGRPGRRVRRVGLRLLSDLRDRRRELLPQRGSAAHRLARHGRRRGHGRVHAGAELAAPRTPRRSRSGRERPVDGRRAHAVPRDQAVAAQARAGFHRRRHRRRRARPPGDPDAARHVARPGGRARHRRGQARLRARGRGARGAGVR